MDIENLKNSIESNYDIKIKSLEKVKNSYKVESKNKNYAIKIIKYDFGHFYFILSAIKHLQGILFLVSILRSSLRRFSV